MHSSPLFLLFITHVHYFDPGSYQINSVGGSKPKVATPEVITKIEQYKMQNSTIFAWEIREKLIKDKVCNHENCPSVSSINRILRKTATERSIRRALFEQEQDLLFQTYYDYGHMGYSGSCCPDVCHGFYMENRQPRETHERRYSSAEEGLVSSTAEIAPIRDRDSRDNKEEIKEEQDEDREIDVIDYYGKVKTLKGMNNNKSIMHSKVVNNV